MMVPFWAPKGSLPRLIGAPGYVCIFVGMYIQKLWAPWKKGRPQVQGSLLGNPRFPLKGSLKGDIDVAIDIDVDIDIDLDDRGT